MFHQEKKAGWPQSCLLEVEVSVLASNLGREGSERSRRFSFCKMSTIICPCIAFNFPVFVFIFLAEPKKGTMTYTILYSGVPAICSLVRNWADVGDSI